MQPNQSAQPNQQGDHIDALIKSLDAASGHAQQVFGGMGGSNNSPFIWVGNGFQKNPNFLDPLQQQQLTGQEQANPTKAAGDAAAAVIGQYTAKNALPLNPQDLTNIVDTSGTPAALGTTQNQINAGKYHGLTSSERDSLVPLQQSQLILNQIKAASEAINTHPGNNFSTGQHITGLLKVVTQDPNARVLQNSQGVLGPILKGLLAVNRYNTGEVQNVSDILPTPYDTQGQAKAKLKRFDDIINGTRKSLGITADVSGSPSKDKQSASGGWTYLGTQK